MTKIVNAGYPIYIGTNLLHNSTATLLAHIAGRQVLIVSNVTVAAYYLTAVEKLLTNYQCHNLLLPDGEAYKTLASFSLIIDKLVELHFNRQCTLIALGGGVISDLTGFAAACYQRGVNVIHIPTTLLAQIDASIGGKTAINHSQGKNLIGAFYPPRCVIIDINTLLTLPQREFVAGIAEMIKHALIADAQYFSDIQTHLSLLLARDTDTLLRLIQRSCEIKAKIVQTDEREQSGQRLLLNFGHTFAHAIETATHYTELLHGEAVAIGMVMAAKLSLGLGYVKQEIVQEIINLLSATGLPTQLPTSINATQVIELFQYDKKNSDLGLQFVLLSAIGQAILEKQVSLSQLEAVL